MKPLISILIPAYNAAPWISDTIKSAIEQSWSRREIVIVDDGSTDDTLAIARRFASRDVVVLAQSNQGAAAARNSAFALAQGDFIQWLDADDLLAADKIARQMASVERFSGRQVLFSAEWAHFVYRPRRARFMPSALWCDLSPVEWILRKWEQNLHMQTATWLVSRELAEAAGPWDSRLLGDDDGEYFCRVVLASEHICHVPAARVFYRTATSSSLSYIGRSAAKQDAQWLSMQLQIDYLRAVADDPRVRAAAVHYLQTWLPYFFEARPDLVDDMQRLATELGGGLHPPRLSWKYAWLARFCGFTAAMAVQLKYNHYKLTARRMLDRILHRLEHALGG